MERSIRYCVLALTAAIALAGCAAYNQYYAQGVASVKMPPDKKLVVGVLGFIEPTPGKQNMARTEIITRENAGQVVADIFSSQLMTIDNLVVMERSQIEPLQQRQKI